MKLYLSSYRIPVEKPLFELFDKKPKKLKGAIITNAKDKKEPKEREQKLDALQVDLAKIGLKNTVFVDLLEHKNPRKLGDHLASFDYLYVAGGNSFDLLSAMRKSGFDHVVEDLLDVGQVYIGESAGAVVVGPSMRGFECVDETAEKHRNKGLGLIDTIIVPHNDSPDPAYNGIAEYVKLQNPNYYIQPLNDNQCFINNGKSCRIYTSD